MGRRNVFAHQPAKAAYTIYYLATALVRLPFAFLYYLPRRLRPVRHWSYQASMTAYVIRLWFYYASVVEYKQQPSFEPGKEGKRFFTIRPAADHFYTGILEDEKVKPEVIGAVWYPTQYSTDLAREKKIILHFHAGAYVLYDGREEVYGEGIPLLSKHFDDAMVLSVEYRLASCAAGRFPAQLQDALTAYRYLLDDLHIEPSRIILCGDSAGGNLVIGLLRHLVNQSSEPASLPFPAGAMLWSPWVDLVGTDALDQSRNRAIDFVEPYILRWGAQALIEDSAVSLSNPYVSPLQAPFKTSVPIWVVLGTAEIFYESIHSFVDSMKDAGNKVLLYEVHDGPHDLLTCVKAFELHTQFAKAVQQARRFLEENVR